MARTNRTLSVQAILLVAATIAMTVLGGKTIRAEDIAVTIFPSMDTLPEIRELPDPFLMRDGRRVVTRDDWKKRREEIKALLAHYQYGRMPPPPGNVTAEDAGAAVEVFDGTAIEKKVTLSFGPEKKLRQGVTLTVPKGPGPFPVILRNWSNPKWSALAPQDAREAVRRGYMLVQYATTDLQADDTDRIGPAKAAYPDYDWGTIAVWAWSGMRVIDYLLTLPEVDGKKIVVTGHSRHGKTALLLGALDDRVAAVIPNAGGSGGFQCWRFPIWPEDRGGVKSHESIALMSRVRTYWFHPRLAPFAKEVQKLPFDQHFLATLVAPRPLCTVEAMEDEYATPLCSQRSYQAAKKVYDWLGASDKIGVYYRRKGGHAQGAEDWAALLDFADAVLLGKSPTNPRLFDQIPYPDAQPGFSWRNPAEGK